MKRTLKLMGVIALAALALAGCKKNEQTGSVTLKATLPPTTSESKTEIGTDNWLVWSSNDQIVMYGYTDNATSEATARNFTVATADVGKTAATFIGTELPEADYYKAFYPAQNVGFDEENRPMIHMDSVQSFVNGNFTTNTYPMFTTSIDGQNLEFFSPCGILAIPMKGTANVGRIVLKDKYLQGLVGDIVPLNGTDTTSHEFHATARTVTLDCGEGVQLNESTATNFYFVVAPSAFMGGFTIDVFDTEDHNLLTKSTTNNCMIFPMTIRVMGEVTGVAPYTPAPTYAVSTDTATMVSPFPISFTINGSYSVTYSKDVTEVGFYYGPGADLTTKVQATVGTSFSYTLENLVKNTDYSYRAYINEGGTEMLGTIKTFHTPDAKYTVSVSASGDSLKVYFAPGNLQYKDGTGWRFAEHQYDHIGAWDPTDWVDLFGWGTWTGSTTSASYNPLNTSTDHYQPPFVYTESSYCWDDADFCQPLINNSETGWRTLSSPEWAYLFAHHVYGWTFLVFDEKVERGYVLFPDGIGGTVADSYDAASWAAIEAAGAVFLPVTRSRAGLFLDPDAIYCGFYWSSTPHADPDVAYYMYLIDDYQTASYETWDVLGYGVRLVRAAND